MQLLKRYFNFWENSGYFLQQTGLTNSVTNHYIKRSNVTQEVTKAMPLYEYQCTDCGNQFELRQKFSDEPAKECPKCSGAVQKLISQSGFALKGGGWYAEGYGGKKESNAPTCPSGGGCAGCPSAAA